MNAFSKIVAVIITVIALFVVPLNYQSQKHDSITQSFVTAKTEEFVETVRTQGKVTQNMFNKFISALDATGLLYTIEMEHAHTQINPSLDLDGNVLETPSVTRDVVYEDEIRWTLYEKRPTETEIASGAVESEYHMTKGDYFTVKVKNSERTLSSKLFGFITANSVPLVQIQVVYGGEIRDENY